MWFKRFKKRKTQFSHMFRMFRAHNVRLQLCHWFLPDPSMADGAPPGRRVTTWRRHGADDAARGTAGRGSLDSEIRCNGSGLVNSELLVMGNRNRSETVILIYRFSWLEFDDNLCVFLFLKSYFGLGHCHLNERIHKGHADQCILFTIMLHMHSYRSIWLIWSMYINVINVDEI